MENYNKETERRARNIGRWLKQLFLLLFVFLSVLLSASLNWIFFTWSELTVDEILYHLLSPLRGAGQGMVTRYLLYCLLPAAAAAVITALLLFLWRRALQKKKIPLPWLDVLLHHPYPWIFALCLFLLLGNIAEAWRSLDVNSYLKSQFVRSSFIEDNYVDPKTVSLQFPEKKRNLIYIFLESTEVTFTDRESGGAFPGNTMPELTRLAQEHEDFSGKEDSRLNGGYSMPGTTWTMGGMFAQTSGLPLKISIEMNAMDSQKTFFPSVETLGDILKREGYNQVLMLGSVGYFGGRKLYFETHGNYAMKDFSYWKRQGQFPSGYWVNWGFEDEKLFSYAREELTRLSEEGKPFNLSLLTVDTHFPDGYVCHLCRNEFPGNQYANVFACSSRQVAEFVAWIQEQSFYPDTTIVLSGDHPTMDHDFCDDVDKSYVRKVYTAYINAAVTAEREDRRDFTTFDDFPTTLAAMGVTIPGERLGLGTNLFGKEDTLTEKYGRETEKTEIEKRSEFMIRLGQIDKKAAIESKEAKELREKQKKK